jgi:hypothetical protein
LIHNHWNQKKANINAISATSFVASKLHLFTTVKPKAKANRDETFEFFIIFSISLSNCNCRRKPYPNDKAMNKAVSKETAANSVDPSPDHKIIDYTNQSMP